MNSQNKILIVGAFNRNFLLAQELRSLDFEIDYLDLSESLGFWPSEDIEGPFGFFRTEELTASDYDLILSGDTYFESTEGFTFYLKSGPLEMKGPMTSYVLNRKPWGAELEKDWISAFSKIYGSCFFHENPCQEKQRDLKPTLFGAFNFKMATRSGFQKQVEYLRSRGIRILQQTQIKDLSFGNPQLVSVEFQGEFQGLQNYDSVIWCLSSEETSNYSEKLSQILFNGQVNESALCWQRYRLRVNQSPEFEVLPTHMVILSDLLAPWSHENQIVFIKTASADLIDLWVMQSSIQRFNKDYIHYQSQKILNVFQNYFPGSEPVIAHYPQEYTYSYKEIGAPRFPIYLKENQGRVSGKKSKRVFFQGPEFRSHYSFVAEKKSYQSLLKDLQLAKLKSKKKEEHP